MTETTIPSGWTSSPPIRNNCSAINNNSSTIRNHCPTIRNNFSTIQTAPQVFSYETHENEDNKL